MPSAPPPLAPPLPSLPLPSPPLPSPPPPFPTTPSPPPPPGRPSLPPSSSTPVTPPSTVWTKPSPSFFLTRLHSELETSVRHVYYAKIFQLLRPGRTSQPAPRSLYVSLGQSTRFLKISSPSYLTPFFSLSLSFYERVVKASSSAYLKDEKKENY